MSLYYSDKIKSTDLNKYGIIDATEISGHKRVNTLDELYQIPDTILSQSGNNTDNDALGQIWHVYESDSEYSLVNWELRNENSGWRKKVFGNIEATDTSETLDDVETNTYVKYVAQTLTDSQKAQVRENIGAASSDGVQIDLSDYYTKEEVDNKIPEQPDWNETDATSSSYIANKPNIKLDEDHNIVIDPEAMPSKIGLMTQGSIGPIGIGIEMNKITWCGFNGENNTEYYITSGGDGAQFLSNDGTYKTLYTTTEIDSKLGDINTVLESIING